MTELDIRTTLASGILDYKDQNPSVRSFKFISDRTKVAESFIKRIAKKDDSVSLDAEKFLSVAKLVLPEEKRKYVVTYFYKKFFSENLEDLGIDSQRDRNCSKDGSLVPPSFDKEIVQEDTLLVYSLASAEHGVSLEEVQYMGDVHVSGLNKLIESGLVTESNGKFHAIRKDWAVGMKSMRKMIKIFTDCYSVENFGKKRNFALCYSFEVSQDGIEILQEKMRDLVDSIRTVKEKYPGDKQIVCSGFFDTISNFCYKDEKNVPAKINQALSSFLIMFAFFGISSICHAGLKEESPVTAQTAICADVFSSNRLECISADSIREGLKTYYKVIGDSSLSSNQIEIEGLFRNKFQERFGLNDFERDDFKDVYLTSCSGASSSRECTIDEIRHKGLNIKPTSIDDLMKKMDLDRLGKTKSGGSSGSGG